MHQNITQGKADHHEALDLYAPSPYPASESKRALGGPTLWPRDPADLKAAIEAWVDKTKILGKAVMHAMCDGLGMSDAEWETMWSLIDKSFWGMRLIGEKERRTFTQTV
jgi:isopenicillin N synthase-like dioxygenase